MTEPVAVPLDSAPERCIMTMEAQDFDSRIAYTNSASWSFAAFRYLQPTTGSEGEKYRP